MDFTDTSRYNREKKRMGAHFVNNRSNLITKIQRSLSYYAASIKKDTESGRTDILIDAEEICRGLLNIVFGYELKNLNQTNRDFPAIDLADDKQRVAVQITSTNTSAKIMDTIHRFLSHSLNLQYDTLLIFILVDTTFRQRKVPPLPPSLNLQIMTFVDLMQTIKTLSIEKLEETASYLKKEIGADDPVASEDSSLIPALTTSVADLSEIERQVLFFAGFLPEAGLERDIFEHSLTLEQKKSVPNLINRGALYLAETLLRVHPDIRSSIPNIIPAPNHITYFDLLWEFENSRHWDRMSMKRENAVHQALAHIFSAAAERFPESALTYSLRSAELWKNIHEYSRALTQERKVLQLLKSVQVDSWEIARAHHFSGECHSALEEHELALEDWNETLALCNKFLRISPYDLATAFYYVGKALTDLKLYEDAETQLLNALELWEDLRRNSSQFSPQSWMKDIYNTLSTVYTKLNLETIGMKCSKNALRTPAEQEDLWQYLTKDRLERFHLRSGLHLPLRSTLEGGFFVGRELELAEIEKRFQTQQVVILSGIGGVGKTELAVRYGQKYVEEKGHKAYMVQFDSSLRQTLLNNVAPNIHNLNVRNMPENEILHKTVDILNSSGKEALLILDNADQANLMALRRELSVLELKVLVTTRQDEERAVDVARLHREELYRLFAQHEARVTPEEMDALIDAVDGHTLTVDLMARALRPGFRAATAEKLLKNLADSSVKKVPSAYQGTADQARIDEHLRTVFRVVNLPEEEKEILRCATLLPEGGMGDGLFLSGFEDEETVDELVQSLIDKGWLLWKEELLKIHPVIRLVCRTELKPTDGNCRAFLHGIKNQYDRKQYDHAKFRQMAEVFETASNLLEDKTGFWAGEAGYLWNALAETQRALACNLRSVEKKEQHQPDSNNLATGYNNVGMTYGALGDHKQALAYKLKALGICERVLPPEHPSLANSYNNVGMSYGALGDHKQALENNLKALAIFERVLPPEHPDLATSYNNVCATYYALGDHKQALEYQLKALAIFERVLPPEHPDLALSYNNVGMTYGALGDHKQALEYNLKALEIRERVLPGNHPDLALSCNNIAWTYYALGRIGEAATHMRRAAEIINRSTLPEHHPDRVDFNKWADQMEAIARQARGGA